MSEPAFVKGSKRALRRPIMFGSALGLMGGVAVGIAGWFESGLESAVAGAVGSLAVFLMLGVLQATYWYARAGGTSYEVSDHHLRVIRRGREVKAWSCSSIHEIEFGTVPLFHQTMFHKAGGGLPDLRVVVEDGARIGNRPDYRTYSGWPLLLVSPERADAAEQLLRSAVAEARRFGATD